MDAAELTKSIETAINKLVEEIDEAKISETMLSFLKMASRFHRYSFFNTFLILFQNPKATQVAGYKAWQQLNRFVRKGEHGIWILVPVFYTNKELGVSEEEKYPKRVKCFISKPVFDVSQTDGEPLPEEPEWRSRVKAPDIDDALLVFAKGKGIVVEITGDMPVVGAEGVSMGNKILILPEAGTRTIIHELAHELLHKRMEPGEVLNTQVEEIEADSVAYVVCEYFNIPNKESPNYLALYRATGKEVIGRLQRIQSAGSEMIIAIENYLDPATKKLETKTN